MIDLKAGTAKHFETIATLRGHGFEIVRFRDERGRFDDLHQPDVVPGPIGKWDDAEPLLEIC